MLRTLRIKNLALVADLTLELRPGCNVITGETGAGKSIIIGALKLLLGLRADRSLIRSGSESCSVEAVLDVSSLQAPLPAFLEENGLEPCEEHQLLLKRVFTAAGSNRQFINGSPTSLQVLGELGQWLVDMHGPHEHQSLLQPARQLNILDAFGRLGPLRDNFSLLVEQRAVLLEARAALVVDERTYAQQLDLLRFQVQEIGAARLREGEEETLQEQYQRATNAARLLQLGQSALALLAENDASLQNQAGALGRLLHDLARTDPAGQSLVEKQELLTEQLHDLQTDLSRYLDRLELDPAQLQELEERVNLLQSLKRKYGPDVAAVITFGIEARERLTQLESRDAELVRLQTALKKNSEELWKQGAALSMARRKLIPRLAKAVMKELADLGFRQSQFDVALVCQNPDEQSDAFYRTGLDAVEFQFAPNPGEPARPLRAIASSGELARVMLALKTVLAAEDEIPVLVFDEVDANVGGETARAVGEKMQQIGRNHQVLCITHLAPVAAQADAHYLVTKQVQEGRTISEIRLLERSERVEELARMLGGTDAAARQHAKALLK